MSAKLFLPLILVIGLAAAACAPRSAIDNAAPSVNEPSVPSAVPMPLPPYPYDPGFWV